LQSRSSRPGVPANGNRSRSERRKRDLIDSRIVELLARDQEFPQILLVIPDEIVEASIVMPARATLPCSMRNSQPQFSAIASPLMF
jgi:hypothetical protein